MALLREIGQQYPVPTDAVYVDPNDQASTMSPGDIAEIWLETDKDVTYLNAAHAIEEILRMKEQYPGFILHYLKIETRTIQIQFSVGPEEGVSATPGSISGSVSEQVALVWFLVIALVAAIAAIFLVTLALTLKMLRGYVWKKPLPIGNALAVARNWSTEALLPNVKITVNGRAGRTGANGEAILFTKLLAGPHVFVGETIEGYDAPAAVEQSVVKDEQIVVTIWYVPTGTPKPTTGWLTVDTTPVKGEVYIEAESQGIAPIHVELEEGTYNIAYSVIEGWETPAPDTATIVGGKSTGLIGYYKPPAAVWWHELIKWAAIGLTATAAAAILIPRISKAVRERTKTE